MTTFYNLPTYNKFDALRDLNTEINKPPVAAKALKQKVTPSHCLPDDCVTHENSIGEVFGHSSAVGPCDGILPYYSPPYLKGLLHVRKQTNAEKKLNVDQGDNENCIITSLASFLGHLRYVSEDAIYDTAITLTYLADQKGLENKEENGSECLKYAFYVLNEKLPNRFFAKQFDESPEDKEAILNIAKQGPIVLGLGGTPALTIGHAVYCEPLDPNENQGVSQDSGGDPLFRIFTYDECWIVNSDFIKTYADEILAPLPEDIIDKEGAGKLTLLTNEPKNSSSNEIWDAVIFDHLCQKKYPKYKSINKTEELKDYLCDIISPPLKAVLRLFVKNQTVTPVKITPYKIFKNASTQTESININWELPDD